MADKSTLYAAINERLGGYDASADNAGSSKVSKLPSASANQFKRTFVTDANAPTFGATVAGGGAVIVPVYSDGTNWKVG